MQRLSARAGSVGQEPVVLEGGFYVFLYPFPDDRHCGSYDVHSLLNGRNGHFVFEPGSALSERVVKKRLNSVEAVCKA